MHKSTSKNAKAKSRKRKIPAIIGYIIGLLLMCASAVFNFIGYHYVGLTLLCAGIIVTIIVYSFNNTITKK